MNGSRFANYMQAYVQGGLRAHGFGAEALAQLTCLYWYAVEFGLINTKQGCVFMVPAFLALKANAIIHWNQQLNSKETNPAGSVLDTDKIYTRGTGEGWLLVGDV